MKFNRILIIILSVIIVALTVTVIKLETVNPSGNDNGKVKTQSSTLKDSSKSNNDKVKELSSENSMLKDDLKKVTHFVNVKDLNSNIIINLKYATGDNVTGKALYQTSTCVLREETAQKLINAESKFEALGYSIEIWDAYRPLSVQKILYDATKDKTYIADPAKGSRHNRGAAVDITLADKDGKELEMPSGFDDFSVNAHRNNTNMSTNAQENLKVLTTVMTECGFTTINSEWWHFDDTDYKNYPVLDINPADFEK